MCFRKNKHSYLTGLFNLLDSFTFLKTEAYLTGNARKTANIML